MVRVEQVMLQHRRPARGHPVLLSEEGGKVSRESKIHPDFPYGKGFFCPSAQ